MHRWFILIAVAGCYGDLAPIAAAHVVRPSPQLVEAGPHALAIEKITLVEVTGEDERRVPRLWVKLALHNSSTAPWQLTASAVTLDRDGAEQHALGFVARPFPLSDTLQPSTTIAPRTRLDVWAVFDDVALAHAATLSVRAGDIPAITIAEPVHTGWEPETPPTVGVLAMGPAVTAFGKRHAAMSTDLSLSVAYRWHELDVGVLGLARGGIEVVPGREGGPYAAVGGGPQLGYTLRAGHVLLRPALAWAVARVGHPMDVTTTRHELDAEIHIGPRRVYGYPFRARDSLFAWSAFVRLTATLGSLSSVHEPGSFSAAFGVSLRLGS